MSAWVQEATSSVVPSPLHCLRKFKASPPASSTRTDRDGSSLSRDATGRPRSMPKPWAEFVFPLPPVVAGFGARLGLERIYHVTHTSSALRILDDRAVGKRLISDESAL